MRGTLRLWLWLLLLAACGVDLGLTEPRPYACTREGPDDEVCAGGWRCGLEGRCVDPALGEPRLCAEAMDCAPRWRCGLALVSLPDGGTFGRCQDTRDAGAYPCTDDSWCELGWRCGPEGACVDARADALEAATATLRSPERINPALPSPITDLAVTSSGLGQVELAVLAPAGVTVISAGRELTSRFLPLDGGQLVRFTGPSRSELVLTVAGEGRTRRSSIDVKGDLAPPSEFAWPPFRPMGLTFDAVPRGPRPTERLIAWSDTAISTAEFPSGVIAAITPPPGTLRRVEGHVAWRFELFAATSTGAYRSAPDGGWLSLDLGLKAACGPGAIDLRVLGSPGDALEVAVLTQGAQAICVALLGAGDGGSLQPVGEDASGCSPNLRATGLRALPAPRLPDGGGERALLGARFDCERDGGVERSVSVCRLGERCLGASPGDLATAPLARARADWDELNLDAIVDRRGFPGVDAIRAGVEEPLTRPLLGSLEAGATRERDVFTRFSRAPDASLVVIAERDAGSARFVEVPSAGLGANPTDGSPRPLVAVPFSTWWLGDDGTFRAAQPLLDDPGPLASFSPVQPLEGPTPLAARWLSDGGAFVVVANDDALFAGDVGGGGRLALRLVPASRSRISSVSVAPTPVSLLDGGSLDVTGHAIALGRLYRFEARNRVWRSEEIGLAELAVTTWYDGPRARVGVETGQILGLPTRVPVSSPVPSPPVTQFASACRHTWAVTPTGVFHLGPPDGGLARWERDEVLHEALGAHEPSVTLVSFGDELIATTPTGVVVRRRFTDCPPR